MTSTSSTTLSPSQHLHPQEHDDVSSKKHSPPTTPGEHVSLSSKADVSKMTERQQIAYLLEHSGRNNSDEEDKADASSSSTPTPMEIVPSITPTATTTAVKKQQAIHEHPPSKDRAIKRRRVQNSVETAPSRAKTTGKSRKAKLLICSTCEQEESEEMPMSSCSGPCCRSFHKHCLLSSSSSPSSSSSSVAWKCVDCSNNKATCFYCKKEGEMTVDLFNCKVFRCGKFYHKECLGKLSLSKMINQNSMRFNCALHYCASCGASGDGKQSVHCFRCPTAYHLTCIPAEGTMFMAPDMQVKMKTKECRRTGLILCPAHAHEPPPLWSTSNHDANTPISTRIPTLAPLSSSTPSLSSSPSSSSSSAPLSLSSSPYSSSQTTYNLDDSALSALLRASHDFEQEEEEDENDSHSSPSHHQHQHDDKDEVAEVLSQEMVGSLEKYAHNQIQMSKENILKNRVEPIKQRQKKLMKLESQVQEEIAAFKLQLLCNPLCSSRGDNVLPSCCDGETHNEANMMATSQDSTTTSTLPTLMEITSDQPLSPTKHTQSPTWALQSPSSSPTVHTPSFSSPSRFITPMDIATTSPSNNTIMSIIDHMDSPPMLQHSGDCSPHCPSSPLFEYHRPHGQLIH